MHLRVTACGRPRGGVQVLESPDEGQDGVQRWKTVVSAPAVHERSSAGWLRSRHEEPGVIMHSQLGEK
jgi:hypothetical protein